MAAVIRNAGSHDRDRLDELLQALNRHEQRIAGNRRIDRAAAEESLEAMHLKVADQGGCFLVAESAGAVVGLLILLYETDDIYIRADQRPYALIADIVVDEQWRRQGVARALMTAAEETAKAAGYRRLLISVLAGNRPAEIAYARQGFELRCHELEKRLD